MVHQWLCDLETVGAVRCMHVKWVRERRKKCFLSKISEQGCGWNRRGEDHCLCSFKTLYRYKNWDSLPERRVDQMMEMKELTTDKKKSHLVKERMLKELKGMSVEREELHRGNQKKRKTQTIERCGVINRIKDVRTHRKWGVGGLAVKYKIETMFESWRK